MMDEIEISGAEGGGGAPGIRASKQHRIRESTRTYAQRKALAAAAARAGGVEGGVQNKKRKQQEIDRESVCVCVCVCVWDPPKTIV